MKRKLLQLLLLVVALVMSIGASAQTDLTTQYLTNANFASTNGWTPVVSGSFKDIGSGKIGTYKVRNEFPAATVDATHPATEYCVGFEARWQGSFASYTQTSKEAIPAGTYVLSYDVQNVNGGTRSANYENRFYVKVGETTYTDGGKEWMKGQSSWTSHSIVFKVATPSTFTVSLGYGTGNNNLPLQETPALYVSHLKLTKLQNATFPVDMTGLLTNPDFGTNDATGWTIEKKGSGVYENAQICPSKANSYEYWANAAAGAGFDFYQTIYGLRAGKYTVTASMWNSENGEGAGGSVNGNVGVYATCGSNTVFKGITTDCGNNNPVTETTDPINVTDGSLRIGVKNKDVMGGRWFGVDYIKLSLVSLTPPDASMVEAIYAQVDATKPMNATTKQNLTNAYSAANANLSFDTYDALTTAVEAAKASISLYSTIANNINISKTQIYNGSALDPTPIDNKYNNGEFPDDYNPGNIFRDFATLYNTQIAAAPGVDYTLGIVNPSFASGDATGWTIEKTGTAWQNAQMKPGDSRNAYEYWANSASGAGFNFHQTISGLPAGIYTISADMLNSTNGEEGASFGPEGQVGVYISNGTQESFGPVTIDKESFSRYTSTPFIVNGNEDIIIGVKNRSQMTGRWFAVDDFKLTYVNNVADYITDLKAQLTEAEAQSQFEADANAAVANNDVAAIDAAFQAAIRTQVSEGANYTATIVNPSFETGDLQGWTVTEKSTDTNVVTPDGNHATTGHDGNYFFNTWWKGVPITQTIENLPNGVYKLSASVASGDQNGDGLVYLTANGAHEGTLCPANSSGEMREATMNAVVTDGTLTIGAVGATADHTFTAEGHWWYKVDNFRLEFVKELETLTVWDIQQEEPTKPFILDINNSETVSNAEGQILVVGNDSIVAQWETKDYAIGYLLKGTEGVTKQGTLEYGTSLKGQLYVELDADNHVFNVITNSGNSITAGADVNPFVGTISAEEAANINRAYTLVQLEVATIQNDNDGIFANQANGQIALDNRIAGEALVLNDGDIVNSITGVTFLEGQENVLAPLSQDAIVPLLWNAEDIEEGEQKGDANPIDLTTSDVMARMQNLAAGDVLKVQVKQQAMARRQATSSTVYMSNVIVTAADGRNIFTLPIPDAEEGTSVVEIPITADIQEEVNNHGMKIAVNGPNTQLVTVLNAKYADTENSIWLGNGTEATLGAVHFDDVRKGDKLTATGENATMLINGETVIISGQALTADEAEALEDGRLEVGGATLVTFTLGDDPRNDTAEPAAGDIYAQNGNMQGIDGMIMTFGGQEGETPDYEFEEVYPEVNKFGAKTNGINQLPVDDNDQSYDPAKENVPTKGTFYKFEPTKDGQLDVTIGLEANKQLLVTEDGKVIVEKKENADFEGNVSFPVEATKTYHVFAPEANLTFFGFKFTPSDADAENIVGNIANFKLLPQNEDGDTLILKDAVVTFIKGDNVFVEDASGAIVFYQTGIQFYVGQKLNGFVVGKNTFIADDNKLPALKRTENTSYKTFKVTENVTPEAKAIAAAEAQKQKSLARFVKLTDVRARKDEKGFNIFVDEQGKGNSIRFEDRFNVFYELPEVIGSVQGIVGINSDGVQIFWPTSKDVPEGAGLTDAEEALLAEAQKLAEDREAVAVGLLDDAITEALAGNGKGLQAAIDQFKANNADQEKDETAKVGTAQADWIGATGTYGREVTTATGAKVKLAEAFGANACKQGTIMHQEVDVENGLYKVELFATSHNAWGGQYGGTATLTEDATDVAHVFATGDETVKAAITARKDGGMNDSEPQVLTLNHVKVSNGKLTMGLAIDKSDMCEWQTIQIKSLAWLTTAKELYAADKAKMQELIGQAEELAADAEKTVGKEELNTALEAAKAAQESIRLNIPEFETEIGKLSAAIDAFNAPYQLLAEAQELAEDRDAVAVGLLDDAIAEAQANGLTDTADLQEAVDQFKANNANNAKATYAADKASMQTLIGQAEELAADEALVNNKEELNTAITAAKAALASNKLTVPEFETEIGNMRQAIADFKEANHMGENTLASGKYVLKNVASGLFWGAGNNWGTRASLLDHSEFVTLTMKPDGKYNMESQVSNGGNAHFFEGDYMDNGSPKALTITPVIQESEEVVDFDGSFYHNWSEVSGTATDNGSANGGMKLNQEVEIGGSIWGNLTGAVPYKNYANITDYKELRIEGTPGATIRLMCNRVTDEGPIYEIKPTFDADGKITIKIDDLKYLNGGTPCDFVALQSIKVPASWAGGTMAATITSMKLVKTSEKAFYTIADGDKCFGYDGTSTVLGKELAANDEKALWEIVPATAAALATATEDEPVDATFMILDSDFGRNNRYAKGLANDANNTKNADLDPAWTFEASNKNNAGLNENMCVESYHSVFNMSQTLADAPKGIYSLTAQAFYRQDGSDNEHLPVFFANDETQTFPLKTGTENSMSDASTSFSNGLYTIEPIFVEVTENGALTVGAKLEGNTALWCIWDNFKLTYYGTEANIENLKSGAETKELKELRQKATQLQNEVEIAAIKTGLTNALNETANVAGAEAVKAAIATLKAAIDPAEASKTAKNVLPKMKQLIDATNVYTQEAYDQYYGTWLAKYEAGTLTKAEADALQDPTVGTGWHAQITVDNFLLSAWDTNPDFTDAPYYINTWSVEGDNDGTNFRVPFFEYFNQEPNILAENTLTATMNGLEAGDYEVTAWVRARAKDAEQTSVYGITMQANDGEAVDVCTGEKVDQFFLNEFTAKGTVGADGVLNIKFNVAADNNIHWLSFKNVKFAKAGSTEPIIEPIDPDLIEIAQDQGKELDNFQRAELEEGNAYNTYTANADLVIAFKMMNIDVTNCDYVVVKFAEPVAAGWHLAFWSNQDLVDVPAGATEYKYVFAEDPKCGVQDGILPQICMMTFFGGYQAPLVAKVTGIYKHQIPAEIAHTWDFTKWSDATVANLKADATASKVAGWSDVEKKADAEAGNEPTALSKDNCFWAIIPEGGELSANGVAIEELKGLYFGETFAGNRSLAIAVNYAEVDASKGFGPYNGPAYLWLGGKNFDCFTIPAVKGGTTIKMGVESHKISDARGVKLLVDGNELTDPDGNAVAAPMTYTEQTWQVPAGIAHNVVVKNTNGCHIYFIDAEQDEATLTSISNVKGYDQNDAIYNLRGQKVQGTLKKGLYIKSGRKVVIK